MKKVTFIFEKDKVNKKSIRYRAYGTGTPNTIISVPNSVIDALSKKVPEYIRVTIDKLDE